MVDKKEHDLNNRKFLNPKVILLLIMTLFMVYIFYSIRDIRFQRDSEAMAVGMVAVAKHNIDNGGIKYGLRFLYETSTNTTSYYEDTYRIYDDGKLYDRMSVYSSQIGLQGWIYYLFTKTRIPGPVFLLRVGNCLLLSLIISLICYELYLKYGLLLASSFYFVSICSSWLRNFSTNLFWVEFTWFIPMLLGLICLNNLNKRFLLYPLFFLAILIKSACGYDYISVIMLSSIMFLVVEWICSIKKDRQRSKLLFRTILSIGIISLLGFIVTLLVHSFMRGDGNILNGLNSIYHRDVLRRTFGNAADFPKVYTNSLNASILDVLLLYLKGNGTGRYALFLILVLPITFIYYSRLKKRSFLLHRDILLFLVTFVTCISWFILAKSYSYIHTHMNYVLWYMGFIQIGTYMMIKYILKILYSINKFFPLRENILFILREEIIRD